MAELDIRPTVYDSLDATKTKDPEGVYDEKRTKFSNIGGSADHNGLYSSNLLFNKNVDWYSKINRYGWVNPFDQDRVLREFLFFTKPDLNLFESSIITPDNLVDGCRENNLLYETARRMPKVLTQLTSSVSDPDGKHNPFMYLLSNAVSSKLDLPSISAESQESTQNIMGTSIQYRSHSLKSDNGFDFTLQFTDTPRLEVYTLAKCYDEYMRLLKQGYCSPKYEYIVGRIIPEQFSVYKFLIGSDGETIIHYSKLTGVYFTDVPRSDIADPGDEVKFSLSFHAQFVEDMNPHIISEFDKLTNSYTSYAGAGNFMPVYSSSSQGVNNKWAKFPKIIRATPEDPIYGKRVNRRSVNYDFFLKWYAM